jgi:hypothetical protein
MPNRMMKGTRGKIPDIFAILDQFAIKNIVSIFTGIFSPLSDPILPLRVGRHLLHCGSVAMDKQSLMGHALHLRQPRFVNNIGVAKGD